MRPPPRPQSKPGVFSLPVSSEPGMLAGLDRQTGDPMRTFVVASALILGLVAIPAASFAQQATPAPETPATAADVAPLAGAWALSMQSPMGPSTSDLTLTAADGKVAAEISSEMIPKTTITQIFKSGSNLVLKYSV